VFQNQFIFFAFTNIPVENTTMEQRVCRISWLANIIYYHTKTNSMKPIYHINVLCILWHQNISGWLSSFVVIIYRINPLR